MNELFAANKAWSESLQADNANYFTELASGQAPEYLWLGCADSRIPAESLLGLGPGELFVHRNVANQANPEDPNAMSVIQYAVTALKVKHIIVCGHVGCGGVNAALNGGVDGYLSTWLKPISELAKANKAELDALPSEEEKVIRLAELNVKLQVEGLANHPIIKGAWAAGQPLSVHGWLFDLRTGLLNDLGLSVSE